MVAMGSDKAYCWAAGWSKRGAVLSLPLVTPTVPGILTVSQNDKNLRDSLVPPLDQGLSAEQMVTMGDVFATICKALGIDWQGTYDTPTGRPIKITNSIDDTTAVPIAELV